MANKYFNGEKASNEEAKKKLMQHAAGVFDGRFTVRFESDDGGSHITLIVEVEDPNEDLDPFLVDALGHTKWMGWRYIIKKVPPGYIDAIIEAVIRDDY